MAAEVKDAKGRPVVVVTGMGVVTSLGRGKDANWSALTAGRSGIKRITRFPTEGLRTTIAGTVDCIDVGTYSAPKLSIAMALAAAGEALIQAGLAEARRFPGPLFLATPPAELEWPQRKALYEAPVGEESSGYKRLLAAARTGEFRSIFDMFQFASVAEHVSASLGTRGLPISVSTACASGASA